MSAVTIAIDLVGNDLTGGAFGSLFGSVGRLNGLLGSLGQQMGNLPVTFGQAGAAGLGAAAAFGLFSDGIHTAVDAAGDLQTATINMSLMVHGAAEKMPELTTAIIDLADHSTYSSSQVADAFAALGKHLITAQEILDGVGQAAIRMALAMGSDAAPAADLLGQVMQVFADQGYTAAQVADMMDAAFHNGIPSVDGLRQVMANAGGMADSLGVHLDDLLSVADLMAPRMGSASQAGTSLRYAMQNMVHPIGPAKDEMKALGLISLNTAGQLTSSKFYDAQGNFIGLGKSIDLINDAIKNLDPLDKANALGALFNMRSGAGIRGLLSGLQDVSDQYDKTKAHIDTAGQAQKDADDRMKAYQAVAKEFGATLTDAWARVGTSILPVLTGIFQWLNKLIDQFNKASPDVHQLVAIFLVVGAVLSGVVVAAIAAVIIIMSPFAALIGIVIGAFVGVIAVAALIVAAFVGLRDAITSNKTLMDLWNGVIKFLGDMLGVLKEQGQKLLDHLQLLIPVWNVLKVVLLVIAGIILGVIVVAIAIVIGVLIAIVWVIDNAIQWFAKFGTMVGQAFSALGTWIHDLPENWKKMWDAVGAAVHNKLSEIGQAIGGFFSGLGTKAHQGLQAVEKFFTDTWNNIKTGVGNFFSGLGTAVKNGLDGIVKFVQGFVNGVVNFFKWLYDHNYYFHDLVEAIKSAFNTARTFLINLWNGIVSFLTGVWSGLVSAVGSFFNLIGTTIHDTLEKDKTTITNIWNGIKDWLSGVWNTISTTAGNKFSELGTNIHNKLMDAKSKIESILNGVKSFMQTKWNEIVSGVQTAWQNVVNAISSKLGAIKDMATTAGKNMVQPILDKATDMFNAGKNAIQHLIDGVKSMLGALGSAIGQAAQKFVSILGFHSPPDEGPAHEADVWMPNMMKMYSRGIEDQIPLVESSLNKVSGVIANKFMTPQIAQAQVGAVPAQQGQLVIPINLDGKQIAQYTVDIVDKKIAQSGGGRFGR